MKRIALTVVPLAVIVIATVAAYLLIGNPRPVEPTPYVTTPIDTPTRDPLAKAEARLAHTLAPAPRDGLRFVAIPPGSDRSYAFQIAVHALGTPAKAVLVVAPRGGGFRRRYRFNVPRQEERAFFLLVDAVLPHLRSETGAPDGGTPAALERIDGGQSRTWTASLPEAEWTPIDTAIRNLLARHAGDAELPAGPTWGRPPR